MVGRVIVWAAVALGATVMAGEPDRPAREEREAKPPARDLASPRDEWYEEARKKLLEGGASPFRRFDELFDDEFFGRKFDPFAEIEDFHRRMAPLLPRDQRSLFGESWNDWFQDRMGLSGIRSEVVTTDKEVVVSFKIPGLKADSLEVDVNEQRIRAAYSAKTVEEKKADGGVARTESVRRFEKIMPIPAGADPAKRRIVREGDSFKVIFERRPVPGLKS